jgi:glycosyltransferase involved in cell wall biosynthesis
MRVNVTIPVYNEEKILPHSIEALHSFLQKYCRFEWEIVIANNASTDRTQEVAENLSKKYSQVSVVTLQEKGRGRALKKVWLESTTDIVSYMDVDLSSNLYAFPPMIEALICGGFDVATGSRLLKGSTTTRSYKREIISRCYNLLVKLFFSTKFSDAQCGFKAMTRRAVLDLVPKIEDTGWFFDTELLVLSEKLGYRIFDLPVSWIEDLDSRVQIVRTAFDDIKGLIRVRHNFRKGQY